MRKFGAVDRAAARIRLNFAADPIDFDLSAAGLRLYSNCRGQVNGVIDGVLAAKRKAIARSRGIQADAAVGWCEANVRRRPVEREVLRRDDVDVGRATATTNGGASARVVDGQGLAGCNWRVQRNGLGERRTVEARPQSRARQWPGGGHA